MVARNGQTVLRRGDRVVRVSSARAGRVDRGKFWRPGWSVVDVPWRQAVIDLRDRVNDSVQSHLVSDVPTGVFLSGRLDSSIIAALAARHSFCCGIATA